MRDVRELTRESAVQPVEQFFESMENIPSSTYYMALAGSVALSLGLFMSGRRWESIFVGLWAPTLLTAGLFYKLLRPSHEMRS